MDLVVKHIFDQWLGIMGSQQRPHSQPRHQSRVLKQWLAAAVAKSTACGGITFGMVIQFSSLGRYRSMPCLEHELMII